MSTMSNKTDQSSSEAKAGVVATRALAGILSPEAAVPAGSMAIPNIDRLVRCTAG